MDPRARDMNLSDGPAATDSPTRTAIDAGKERAKAVLAGSQASPGRKRKRETPADQIQLNHYVNREYAYKADLAERRDKPLLLLQKKAELQNYQALRAVRENDPGAIFGQGYDGYGNPRTSDRAIRDPLLYPRVRRFGKKQNRLPKHSRREKLIQAEQEEELVPIRLDIEWGKIKLRDTLTWNINDRTASIEYFAEKLVEDFSLDAKACAPLVQKVVADIREQLQDYTPHIFTRPEPVDPYLPYVAYKNDEMRILVKLNITIGQNTLIDQFEWEVNNPDNSPEEFARQMTHDLSLAGEFTTAIAHCIREQSQLYTRSLHLTGYPWDGRVIDDPDLKENFLPSPMPILFRPYQMAKEYSPYIYELNEADLERTEMSISRAQRLQKRSTNRRGGPALPDLKEKPKTIRSLVVSSVIPGGALTMEDSRVFRKARQRTKPGRGQRDDFEDSEGTESEDSAPDSPLPTHLLAPSATRTRGMRTAALTATAGIRNNFSGVGRSATPEVSAVLEPRSAARRRDYKESSDDDEERLVVILKVGKQKMKEWARAQRLRDRVGTSTVGSPGPSKMSRPASATPLNLAAQPPPLSPQGGGKPAENMFGAIDAPPEPENPMVSVRRLTMDQANLGC